MKKIIVGDVHGCYNSLKEVLAKAELDQAEDTLIFVGDLFDRGYDSAEVWKLVSELKQEMGDRCVVLYGNHEDMLVKYVLYGDTTWTINGMETTVESFENDDDVPSIAGLAAWIMDNTTPYYHCTDGTEFYVVHAGRVSDDIEKDSLDDHIWNRDPIRHTGFGGTVTFIGHTPIEEPFHRTYNEVNALPYDEWIELPKTGLVDIDTACVFGNRLTAAVVDGNKFKCVAA